MNYRDKIAHAVTRLAGVDSVIDDLNISDVIDVMMDVCRDAASQGYDTGQAHMLTQGTKKEFLERNFPDRKTLPTI